MKRSAQPRIQYLEDIPWSCLPLVVIILGTLTPLATVYSHVSIRTSLDLQDSRMAWLSWVSLVKS